MTLPPNDKPEVNAWWFVFKSQEEFEAEIWKAWLEQWNPPDEWMQ